ncbi:MAG: DUF3592 domain-containing protein [bacterium]
MKKGFLAKIFFVTVLVALLSYFSYITFVLVTDQLHMEKTAYRSEGTVVSFPIRKSLLKLRHGVMTNTNYFTNIQYVTKEGETRIFTSYLASSKPAYSIGEKVKILIPSDGGDPQVDSFTASWVGPIILGVFVLLNLLILLYTIYRFYLK